MCNIAAVQIRSMGQQLEATIDITYILSVCCAEAETLNKC